MREEEQRITMLVRDYIDGIVDTEKEKGVKITPTYSQASGRPQFINVRLQREVSREMENRMRTELEQCAKHVIWIVKVIKDTVYLNVNTMHPDFGLQTISEEMDIIIKNIHL